MWRGCWGYISVYENTFKKLLHLPPNSCLNFTQWFKEGHSWSISSHIVKANVGATYANTSSSHVHWRKWPNWQAHLEFCHKNPDILERVLNWIELSNSTMGKYTPMQVMKQPKHGRTSTTEEQKWSSFQ